MKNFDTRAYNISDFVEWQAGGLLILSPKFQRRAVWTQRAKSYLVDTVMQGKPMPKVLITQGLVDGRNVRTVIDGQQRLRAILEFLDDNYRVSRTYSKEHGGKLYSELPAELKNEILQYELGVDVLFNTELPELLDIFARLNTYSVKLNRTELLNASYLGAFKTQAHLLGHSYAEFLLEAKVLSPSNVARMAEVELLSDLLGGIIVGISSKKSIPTHYRKFDDADQLVLTAAADVRKVMSRIAEIYSPADLSQTNFRRIHFFYSLFMAVAAIEVGVPGLEKYERLTSSNSTIRVEVDELSANFDDEDFPKSERAESDFATFISGARRATTDQPVRQHRTEFILRRLERAGVS